MGPNIWGPHGWKFIHFVTLAYPNNPTETDKQNYKTFFYSLCNVIPCVLCADNYRDHIGEYPLTDEILSDKNKLMEWGVLMHNLVNKENSKEIYSNDKALSEISNNFEYDSKECMKNLMIRNKLEKFAPIPSTNQEVEEKGYFGSSKSFCFYRKIIVSIIIIALIYKIIRMNLKYS